MRVKRRRFRRYRPAAPLSVVRLLPRPRVEIDRGLAWYVLWTAPRAERRVAEALQERGLATYVPLEAVTISRRGRPIQQERPAVGRYVFVGLNGARPEWTAVYAALDGPFGWLTGIPALGRVLKADDVPLRVPCGALQRLSDGLATTTTNQPLLTAGGACKAISGAFAGFVGIVEEADDCRVRALLDVFGRRTRVEFEPGQLEAA